MAMMFMWKSRRDRFPVGLTFMYRGLRIVRANKRTVTTLRDAHQLVEASSVSRHRGVTAVRREDYADDCNTGGGNMHGALDLVLLAALGLVRRLGENDTIAA